MTEFRADLLQLKYGVNAFADQVYDDYKPPKITAHYPDPTASQLRQAIADYVGCDESMILCASGSDELIDLYLRIHKAKAPGLKMAFSPPTYPQYEVYGKRTGAQLITLPADMSQIDADVVRALGGNPKDTVVMLDSPSNPSGEEVSREQFRDLLEAGYQVFADEAYYEFCGNTVADWINKYPDQLVVSRSFSKFAAMSGSRVGYLIAQPWIVEEFRNQQLFFNVNTDGQHRALYALQHIKDFQEAIADMREAKQKLVADIKTLGQYRVFASLDMYLIFSHLHMPTAELHERLLNDYGIETQRFADFKGHDVIRSALLKGSVMQRLTNALGDMAKDPVVNLETEAPAITTGFVPDILAVPASETA